MDPSETIEEETLEDDQESDKIPIIRQKQKRPLLDDEQHHKEPAKDDLRRTQSLADVEHRKRADNGRAFLAPKFQSQLSLDAHMQKRMKDLNKDKPRRHPFGFSSKRPGSFDEGHTASPLSERFGHKGGQLVTPRLKVERGNKRESSLRRDASPVEEDEEEDHDDWEPFSPAVAGKWKTFSTEELWDPMELGKMWKSIIPEQEQWKPFLDDDDDDDDEDSRKAQWRPFPVDEEEWEPLSRRRRSKDLGGYSPDRQSMQSEYDDEQTYSGGTAPSCSRQHSANDTITEEGLQQQCNLAQNSDPQQGKQQLGVAEGPALKDTLPVLEETQQECSPQGVPCCPDQQECSPHGKPCCPDQQECSTQGKPCFPDQQESSPHGKPCCADQIEPFPEHLIHPQPSTLDSGVGEENPTDQIHSLRSDYDSDREPTQKSDTSSASDTLKSDLSSFLEDAEEELSCLICFELHMDPHTPKNLDCGHVCCAICLQELLGKSPNVECPACRHVTTVSDSQVTSMKTNHRLRNLAEIYHKHSQKDGAPEQDTSQCSEHGDRLRFYCQTCNTVACGTCVCDKHNKNEHDVKDLQEVYDEQKSEMDVVLQMSSKRSQENVDRLSNLQAAAQGFHNLLALEEETISRETQQMIEKIQKAAEAKKIVIRKGRQAQLEAMDSQKRKLEIQQGEIHNAVVNARGELEKGKEWDYVMKHHALVAGITTLLEQVHTDDVDQDTGQS